MRVFDHCAFDDFSLSIIKKLLECRPRTIQRCPWNRSHLTINAANGSDIVPSNNRRYGKNDQPFHQVLQLPDIAWVFVLTEKIQSRMIELF